MNQQFQTQYLLEEFDADKEAFHQKMVDYLVKYCGANKDAASMLAKAATDHLISFEKAIEICKATTGISEDGSMSTGVAPTLEPVRVKKMEEDAPMLAHGKADISTYIKDKFTKVEGHPKGLTIVQPKDLWGTPPTAMSELEETVLKATMEKLDAILKVVKEKSPKIYGHILDLIADTYPHDEEVEALVAKAGLQENYNRFKKETKIRPKQDQYHEAIKVANKKLDEVNRILEFTSRMKEELSEGEDTLEVKARTAKTMDKLKTKIAEAYKKLKHLN